MPPRTLPTTVAVGVAAALAGCATVGRDEVRTTEQELAAAGFDIKLADSEPRGEHLETLRRHRLIRIDRDGRPYYVYADPDWCECMYVGNQADYDAYRRLTAEQGTAEERKQAAAIDEDAAMDWDLWEPWPYE